MLIAKPIYDFDANASYIVVGGLGGIGRSIARWLTDRCAKNLILLSRSGAREENTTRLIEELRRDGVRGSPSL